MAMLLHLSAVAKDRLAVSMPCVLPQSWPLLALVVTFGGGNIAVTMMFNRSMRRFKGGSA